MENANFNGTMTNINNKKRKNRKRNNKKSNNNMSQKKTNIYENYSDNESSLNSSNTDSKHIVCIENVLTGQIVNDDIEELLQLFLEQNSRYEELGSRSDAIDSIRVFTNSIYVFFDDEVLAYDAASFFNNYKFKEFLLRACVIFNNGNDDEHSRNGNEHHNLAFKSRYMKPKVSMDCEILIENRQLKQYSDSVIEKLCKELIGVNTYSKYLNDELKNQQPLSTTDIDLELKPSNSFQITNQFLKEALDKHLLYIIYLNQSNEQFNSINFLILNKWRHVNETNKKYLGVKEYKNMPLNKALELLKSDYIEFINYLKSNHSKQNKPNSHNEFSTQENENGNCKSNKPHILLDKRQKSLINILLTKLNKSSSVNMFELDLIITYLNKKKDEIVQDFSSDLNQDNQSYNGNGGNTIPPLIPPSKPIGDLMSINQPPSQPQQQSMAPLMRMNEFMSLSQPPQHSNQMMNLGDLMSLNQTSLMPMSQHSSPSLLLNPPPSLMSLMNQSQSLMGMPTSFGNNNQSGFFMNNSIHNYNRY